MESSKVHLIRSIYLYGVSIIAVVVMLISTIGMVQLVLSEYVFQVDDWASFEEHYQCTENELLTEWNEDGTKRIQKYKNPSEEEIAKMVADCIAKEDLQIELRHKNDMKSSLVSYISMLLVALPLYLFHWGLIKKER